MKPALFIKQLGLSEGGLVFPGGFVQSSQSSSDEVIVSQRRADEGEVRLTCMPFVAPVKTPFVPRSSGAGFGGDGDGCGGCSGMPRSKQ